MALTLNFAPLPPYVSGPANQVVATPDGTSGLPTIRALVATDIPASLNSVSVTGSAEFLGTLTTFATALSSVPGGNLGLVSRRDSGTGPLTSFGLWNANTTNGNGTVFSFRTDTTGAGAASYQQYACVTGTATVHNNATLTGTLAFNATTAGAQADELTMGGGVFAGAATGGAKGIGTVDASSYYQSGTLLAASNLSNGTTGSGAVVLAGSPTFTGVVNAVTGYQVNGAATVDHTLRGDGTNFVDAGTNLTVSSTGLVKSLGSGSQFESNDGTVRGVTGVTAFTTGQYSIGTVSSHPVGFYTAASEKMILELDGSLQFTTNSAGMLNANCTVVSLSASATDFGAGQTDSMFMIRDTTNGGACFGINLEGVITILNTSGATAFVSGAPGATQIQIGYNGATFKLTAKSGASRNSATLRHISVSPA